MMGITSISVVSIPVSDQDRAARFYTGALGYTLMADTADTDDRWVMLSPPGGGAAITLVTWFPTMPPGSLKGLVVDCDDADKTLTDLRGRGVAVDQEEVQDASWGRWFSLGDPDGNGIVVRQPPEQ
jgi:catechol 2,3-dioxygenase-like lactoylglutathione lyase family enzyme